MENKLYGGWITPKGELIPVSDTFGHMDKFCEVVLGGKEPKRYHYSLAFRLGYIRLIFKEDGIGYVLEFEMKGRKVKPTKDQKTWVENAADSL